MITKINVCQAAIKRQANTLKAMKTEIVKSLDELIRSRFFEMFESDRLGNDLFLSDPERAARIHTSAENGADGSTHGEHIDDWREANELAQREVYCSMFNEMGFPEDISQALAEKLRDEISAEIDACEEWHQKNGSLDQQCG